MDRSIPLPGSSHYDCYDISLALWGDSKVLLVGGVQNSKVLSTGGVWNAKRLQLIRVLDLSSSTTTTTNAVERWSALPCQLHQTRANSSVMVVNNRLYVFGGTEEGAANTFEIVDLIENTVTELTQPMAWQRMKCMSYQDNFIFLFGGCSRDEACDEFWCFDTKTNEFQPMPSMKFSRCRPAIGLFDDSIIVAGGLTKLLSNWQPSVEAFHIPSGTWRQLEDMPIAEKILAGFALDSGIFVVCTKDSVMRYIWLEHSWTDTAPLDLERVVPEVKDFQEVLLIPGKHLIVSVTQSCVELVDVEDELAGVYPDSNRQGTLNPSSYRYASPTTGPRFKDQSTRIQEHVPFVVATMISDGSDAPSMDLAGHSPRSSGQSGRTFPAIHAETPNHVDFAPILNGLSSPSTTNSRHHGGGSGDNEAPSPTGISQSFSSHTSCIRNGSFEEVGSLTVDSCNDPKRHFPMRVGKPKFFIAHYGAESKEEVARPTHWFLTHYVKVDVFMDDEVMEPGTDQELSLLKEAYECTHALMILTPSFRQSPACVRELNSFMDRWERRDGIRVIPALWRIDDVQGYCKQLDKIVWVRNQPGALDAAAYMVTTLWPAILRTLTDSIGKKFSTARLEKLLALYVWKHRAKVNVPLSLNMLAARHENRCCQS